MKPVGVSYTEFKRHLTNGAQMKYVDCDTYYLAYAVDTIFSVVAQILKGSDDASDFETNILSDTLLKHEVVTQYEKDDKRLKLAKIESTFDGNNVAECLIEVPSGGRYIAGGYVFTDVFCAGDAITEAVLVDVNNLAGYGAGTILASYSDEGVPEANQGWYLEPYNNNTGYQEIEPIGGYGFLPEGFFLRIRVKRKSGSGATKAYCSVWWGKLE